MTLSKEDIIQHIINQEMDFFEEMNKKEEIPENTKPAFRRMRWMTYSALSETTLRYLLRDLLQARADCRNTMIEKYALIDGLIETIQVNPIIEKIANQEQFWMEEIAAKYPLTVQGHDDNKSLFKHYMMCELQSWSPEAISSYWEDIQKALKEGINLAEVRYDNLYLSLGKGTLHELSDSLESN